MITPVEVMKLILAADRAGLDYIELGVALNRFSTQLFIGQKIELADGFYGIVGSFKTDVAGNKCAMFRCNKHDILEKMQTSMHDERVEEVIGAKIK